MQAATEHSVLQVETTNRQILRLALPIALALLVPQINFIVNNVFISGLGESELATAGITGVFYLIFALIGNGLNSGLQSLLSRRAGENRPEEMGKLFVQGLWISAGYAFAGIAIIWVAGPPILAASVHSEEVYNDAVSFLRIRAWGIPFLYVFQMCNAVLVSTNNSRYMKFGFWIQAILNILLDYALIFGHWGLPALGFNGAAWASVIAEAAGLLVVLFILFYNRFHTEFGLFRNRRFDPVLSGLVFRQSAPLVGQYLISILAWLLFYIFIEHQGERPLAISNTMRNVFGIIGIFTWSFASTANAMISNIIGQGRSDQVPLLIRKIVRLSLLLTGILCLSINLYPEGYLDLYGLDTAFSRESIPVIRMVTAGIVMMSVATVWLNAVTGTGHTRVNLLIEAVAIATYTVYVYLVVEVWHWSLVWAWASEILYWFCLFILSYLYIRSGRWKRKAF